MVTLRFWALGREGEVVKDLVPEFERRNPGIHVDVQQIPVLNAHEKLLTAFVGGTTPDLAQVGNTWIPGARLPGRHRAPGRAGAALGHDHRRATTSPASGTPTSPTAPLYGIPWYVDTRLLFYRTDLLAAAGFPDPPRTWSAVAGGDAAGQGPQRAEALRHPPADRRVRAAGDPRPRASAPACCATATATAPSAQPAFRQAASFYVGLFRGGLAPVWSNSQVANLYQQFAAGDFAMYITGPWNVGEFRRRLPPEMQGKWTTAPLPAPDGSARPARRLRGRRREPGPLPRLPASGGGLEADRVPLRAGDAGPLLRAHRRPAGAGERLGLQRWPATPRPPPSAPSSSAWRRCPRCRSGSRSRPDLAEPASPPSAAARASTPPWPISTRGWTASWRSGARCWRGGERMPAEAIAAMTPGGRCRARCGRPGCSWRRRSPSSSCSSSLPIAAALLLSLTDFDLYAVADWHNLRFVGFANYARPAARSAVLEGAAQHRLLRAGRRPADRRRLARRRRCWSTRGSPACKGSSAPSTSRRW